MNEALSNSGEYRTCQEMFVLGINGNLEQKGGKHKRDVGLDHVKDMAGVLGALDLKRGPVSRRVTAAEPQCNAIVYTATLHPLQRMADTDGQCQWHRTVPLNGADDSSSSRPFLDVVVCFTSVPDEKRVSSRHVPFLQYRGEIQLTTVFLSDTMGSIRQGNGRPV